MPGDAPLTGIKVLDLTKLSSILRLYDTEAAARLALTAPSANA